MHPLYQRLRELDWDTFQRFVCQLVQERHPGLKIEHVEGAGGDGGLDIFMGGLDAGPVIWQCKNFANGLGPRQRPQVKGSLQAAVANFKPKQWILVVPTDLSDKAHVWFQKLQGSYVEKTSVGLFQASDIVRELIHRRALRDAFFPGAVIDSVMVRRAIGAEPHKALANLGDDASDQIHEMIARLEEKDALIGP